MKQLTGRITPAEQRTGTAHAGWGGSERITQTEIDTCWWKLILKRWYLLWEAEKDVHVCAINTDLVSMGIGFGIRNGLGHWTRMAGGLTFSICPFVRTRYSESEWTDFDANWHQWSSGVRRSKVKVAEAAVRFLGLAEASYLGSIRFSVFPLAFELGQWTVLTLDNQSGRV